MKVFFCWSGAKSKTVAECLGSWIGQVIQAVEPWISTGITKGKRWQLEIGDYLEEAGAGVVCLTRDNVNSPWIHYESGALAKTKETVLCTFLLNLEETDIKEPLSWFQNTKAKKDDIRKLIHDLNKKAGDAGDRRLPDKVVNELFDINWPRLDDKLQEISQEEETIAPVRTEGEMIQETLLTVREIMALLQERLKDDENNSVDIKTTPGTPEHEVLQLLNKLDANGINIEDLLRKHLGK